MTRPQNDYPGREIIYPSSTFTAERLRQQIIPSCPYFKLYEVFKSDIAVREGINNYRGFSNHKLTAARELTLRCLSPARKKFGPIIINSWYRHPDLERFICKKAYENWAARNNKQRTRATWAEYLALKSHPTGGAADIEAADPTVSNYVLYKWREANVLFDQLILEYYTPGVPNSGWVHISVRTDGTDRGQAWIQNI